MKKLLSLLAVTFPLLGFAQNNALENAVDRAVSTQTSLVKVWVKLVKPVRMSDVMFRRPRGKDMIIDWKQKENNCTGVLHTGLQRVSVPTGCVQKTNYQIAQIKMTFANGKTLKTSGRSVRLMQDKAFISLQ